MIRGIIDVAWLTVFMMVFINSLFNGEIFMSIVFGLATLASSLDMIFKQKTTVKVSLESKPK